MALPSNYFEAIEESGLKAKGRHPQGGHDEDGAS